jgi:hypothetical protein
MNQATKAVNVNRTGRIVFEADQEDTEFLIAKLGFTLNQKPNDEDVFLICTQAGVLAGKWYRSTEEGFFKPLAFR